MGKKPSNPVTKGHDANAVGKTHSNSILPSILTAAATIITVMISMGFVFTQLGEMNTNIEHLQDQVDAVNSSVNYVNKRVNGLWKHVLKSEGEDPDLIDHLTIESEFQKTLTQTYAALDCCPTDGAAIESTSFVLYSTIDGEEHTAKEAAGKKLLLPYTDGDRKYYFYGQLDEEGKWDGDCIINVYKEGKLELITEADYNKGSLQTFRQAFPGSTTKREDVWYFSTRTMEDGFSSGETWDYFRNGDYQQDFVYEDVVPDNILTIDRFQSQVSGALEGYYSGNTSNGRFNDDTGCAYMVKYFKEDGTIRTLYVGDFKNGFPEDPSDEAWLIGRNSTGEKYSYYKGPTSNGSAAISPYSPNADKYWEFDINQDRIDALLVGMTFKCELTWAEFADS